jgi:hypothetical protein
MMSNENPKSRLEADAPLCPKCKTRMKVRNRPLADLYVRKDQSHFRIRVQLESGQHYVITIREEW